MTKRTNLVWTVKLITPQTTVIAQVTGRYTAGKCAQAAAWAWALATKEAVTVKPAGDNSWNVYDNKGNCLAKTTYERRQDAGIQGS